MRLPTESPTFRARWPERRGLVFVGLAACVVGALSCADLQTRPEGACGNLAVEPENGEECDGQSDCGDPGSARACRFTCDPAVGVCSEPGFGCGVDGVCRRPSGQYEPLRTFSTPRVRDLRTGDLNGDGCSDIVYTTSRGTMIKTLASQADGYCFEETQELPIGQDALEISTITAPAPVLLDLTNDGVTDLVATRRGLFGDGFFAYLGGSNTEGHVVTPLLYPTLRADPPAARPFTVRLNGNDALLLFAGPAEPPTESTEDPPAKSQVMLVEDLEMGPKQMSPEIPARPGQLAILSRGEFDESNAACDEVLIGIPGDVSIRVYQVCSGGAPELQSLDAIALPAGTKIRGRNAMLAVVDKDGDGHLDAVFNVEGASKLFIASGLGDGSFLPPTELLGIPSDATSPDALFVLADVIPELPGLEATAVPCPPSEPSGSPTCDYHPGTCELVVSDFDADGAPDAAFNLGVDPSIFVVRTGKSDSFHVSVLPTTCPPRYLTAGDFDNDGISDIAFFDPVSENRPAAEDQPASHVSTARLSIAYGRAFDIPQTPEEKGRFESPTGLAAGRFVVNESGVQLLAGRQIGPPAMPQDPDKEGKGSGVALVEDRGARIAQAAFYFPGAPTMGGDSKNIFRMELLSATSGQFEAKKDPSDDATSTSPFGIALITRPLEGDSSDVRLWLIAARAGGSSLVPVPKGGLSVPACDACLLIPVDTDGDGIDEVLRLDGAGGGATQAIVYAIGSAGIDGGFEERASFPVTHAFGALVENDVSPRQYSPGPIVEDIDGDGRSDVLLRDTTGTIVVLWGNDNGTFTDETLAGAPSCEAPGSCVAALAQADTDLDKEMFIFSPDRMAFYEIDRGARALDPNPDPDNDPAPAPPGSDFAAVRAADVDGDGVEDLVIVLGSGSTLVLRGKPVIQ